MDLEQKLERLSRRMEALFLGLKAFLLLFLLLACVGNFAAVFSIDRYRQMFADTLPGQPLPAMTQMVVSARTLLSTLVFVWPAIGIVAAFLRERIVLSLVLFCAAILGTLLECTVVVLAMQMLS